MYDNHDLPINVIERLSEAVQADDHPEEKTAVTILNRRFPTSSRNAMVGPRRGCKSMSRGEDQERMSKALASFVSSLKASDIPTEAFDVTERSFVDTVGVILAGRGEREARIGRRLANSDSIGLLGGGNDELGVAFANAMAGHCLDFDDCYRGSAIHPSVTVIPALFALADNDTSGVDLLAAYVSGVETQGFLAEVLMPRHYEVGWHATATIGTFGVAAAAANLLGLEESMVEHGLNIAASLPAGLKRNFGTTTKSIHAGVAARSGLTAAKLAAAGATADEHAIDGPRGFLDLYNGDINDGTAGGHLGSDWYVLDPGIQLKKFPCCNYTHSSIEAALRLRRQLSWIPEEVDQVTVSVSEGAVDTVTHEDPETPLEAKFSFNHPVAAALTTGEVSLDAFDSATIANSGIRRLRERVSVDVDPSLSYESLAAEVIVNSVTGDEAVAEVAHPPGAGNSPLSEQDLRKKFLDCASAILDPGQATDVFDSLRQLRNCDSLSALAGM